MKFERFEDILVWQKARVLVNKIYAVTAYSRDRGFNDQIQRASVSVMNNIAEGYERRSNNEFRNFLYISKGSCGEVRSMLYIASDLNIITKPQYDELNYLCIEVSRMLSGLIKTLDTPT